MLALNICNREYDASLLSKTLPPTAAGISMGDVKYALLSHAVAVEARTDLTIRNVVSLAHNCDFLLVHIPQYQRWDYVEPHYVLVMRDSSQEVMLIDPPRSPVNLETASPEELNELTGLTALVCTASRNTSAEAWSISNPTFTVTSDQFVDGVFKEEITLRNHDDSPIAIVSSRVSCPCIRLQFSPTIIPPHDSISYSFTVDESMWGATEQSVTFIDATGASRMTSLVGRVSESDAPATRIQEKEFLISKAIVVPRDCGIAPLKVRFSVPIAQEAPEQATVVATSVECNARVLENGSRGYELAGELILDREFVRSISEASPLCFSLIVNDNGRRLGRVKCIVSRDCEYSYSSKGAHSQLVDVLC